MEKCEYQKKMDELGLEQEDLFSFSFHELKYIISELSKYYNSNNVNDMDSYLVKFVSKMLNAWQSIYLIANNNKDLSSLFALTRMLVDNFAVINLIYQEPNNKEEQKIRYLLYLLDGVKTRNKNIINRETKFDPEYITKEDYEKLQLQCKKTITNDESAIDYILINLKNTLVHQTIIDNSDWKYKNVKEKSHQNNRYKWCELYNMFYDKSTSIMINTYSSQFIHGLSISNMMYEENISDFSLIIGIGITLMSKTKELIQNYFSKEIGLYNIDFKKEFVENCYNKM